MTTPTNEILLDGGSVGAGNSAKTSASNSAKLSATSEILQSATEQGATNTPSAPTNEISLDGGSAGVANGAVSGVIGAGAGNSEQMSATSKNPQIIAINANKMGGATNEISFDSKTATTAPTAEQVAPTVITSEIPMAIKIPQTSASIDTSNEILLDGGSVGVAGVADGSAVGGNSDKLSATNEILQSATEQGATNTPSAATTKQTVRNAQTTRAAATAPTAAQTTTATQATPTPQTKQTPPTQAEQITITRAKDAIGIGMVRISRLRGVLDGSLYYRGDLGLLNARKVSIVGSRRMSAYTRTLLSTLVARLRALDCVVVSGGALGVDIWAARCAYPRTIAVMPSSLDTVYPRQNAALISDIYRNCLALSEYAHNPLPQRWDFLDRNRLVVGLGDALIIAQADMHSGSLNSARHALEQGKPIYVLPHRIGESDGTNDLLARHKARLIHSIDGFIDEMSRFFAPSDSALGGVFGALDDVSDGAFGGAFGGDFGGNFGAGNSASNAGSADGSLGAVGASGNSVGASSGNFGASGAPSGDFGGNFGAGNSASNAGGGAGAGSTGDSVSNSASNAGGVGTGSTGNSASSANDMAALLEYLSIPRSVENVLERFGDAVYEYELMGLVRIDGVMVVRV